MRYLLTCWTLLATLATCAVAEEKMAPLSTASEHLLPDTVTFHQGQQVRLLDDVVDRPSARREQRKAVAVHRVAVPTAGGVRVTAPADVPLDEMSEPWLLAWFGPAIHEDANPYGTGKLRAKRGSLGLARWDRPTLIVCTRRPTRMTAGPAGLSLAFAKEATVAALPLMGRSAVRAAVTRSWDRQLPEKIARLARLWTDLLLSRPSRVDEHFRFDGDDLLLQYRFSYEPAETDWPGARRRSLSFLPTNLALAMQWGGYPARIGGQWIDTGHADTWGPVLMVDGPAFTVRLPGVAKYVWQRRTVTDIPDTELVRDVRNRLAREARRTADAGLLAPVRYWYGEAWIHYFYQQPLETTAPAREILRTLGDSPGRFDRWCREYLSAYPPAAGGPVQGRDDGRRREWAPGHAAFVQHQEMFHSHVTAFQRASALADATDITGSLELPRKDLAHAHSAIQQTARLAGRLDYRTWTMPRKEAHLPEVRTARNGPHVLTSGLIASARLLHKLGHRDQARAAAAAACKTLLAHATYPALLGAWHDGDARDSWQPAAERIHYRYIVPRITRKGPSMQSTVWGNFEYQVLTDMTPEIARFWRDAPKDMAIRPALRELYDWAREWYMADGLPSFHIAEMSRQPPDCAWWMFRGQAWVLQAPANQLARWIDIPFCRVGDLAWMEKMALTVQAAGRETWNDVRE
jgi:hypothetical protein